MSIQLSVLLRTMSSSCKSFITTKPEVACKKIVNSQVAPQLLDVHACYCFARNLVCHSDVQYLYNQETGNTLDQKNPNALLEEIRTACSEMGRQIPGLYLWEWHRKFRISWRCDLKINYLFYFVDKPHSELKWLKFFLAQFTK